MLDNFLVNFDKIKHNKLWIKTTLFTLIFGIIFAVIALSKGVISSFTIAVIPMILVNEIIIIYGMSQGAKRSIVIPICIINYMSALSQAMLGFAGAILYLYLFFAFIAIFIFCLLTLKLNRVRVVCIAFIFMLGTFAACLFTKDINGVRGWVSIFGISIQITEVAKLFYLLCVGSLFSLPIAEKHRFIIGGGITLVFVGILFIISELGTALVVLSAFAVTVFVTFKKIFWKLIVILFLLLAIITGAVGYNVVAKDMYKWQCPYCDTINQDAQICKHCEKTVVQAMTFRHKADKYDTKWICPDCSQANNDTQADCKNCRKDVMADGSVFSCNDCKFTQWKGEFDKKSNGNPELCDNCNGKFRKGLFGIGKTVKKVYDRFVVVYGYDKVQGTGEAYHMEMNKRAIKMGGLFGNSETIVAVPNFDTDSVFAALVNRLGIFFGMFIMLIFLILFFNTYDITSPFRMLAMCIFIFQALYTFLGTLNLFPMTGIGIPLLSRGGSNFTISYVIIYYILTARHVLEVPLTTKSKVGC